jgi:hypothetical protein
LALASAALLSISLLSPTASRWLAGTWVIPWDSRVDRINRGQRGDVGDVRHPPFVRSMSDRPRIASRDDEEQLPQLHILSGSTPSTIGRNVLDDRLTGTDLQAHVATVPPQFQETTESQRPDHHPFDASAQPWCRADTVDGSLHVDFAKSPGIRVQDLPGPPPRRK